MKKEREKKTKKGNRNTNELMYFSDMINFWRYVHMLIYRETTSREIAREKDRQYIHRETSINSHQMLKVHTKPFP